MALALGRRYIPRNAACRGTFRWKSPGLRCIENVNGDCFQWSNGVRSEQTWFMDVVNRESFVLLGFRQTSMICMVPLFSNLDTISYHSAYDKPTVFS